MDAWEAATRSRESWNAARGRESWETRQRRAGGDGVYTTKLVPLVPVRWWAKAAGEAKNREILNAGIDGASLLCVVPMAVYAIGADMFLLISESLHCGWYVTSIEVYEGGAVNALLSRRDSNEKGVLRVRKIGWVWAGCDQCAECHT